MVGFYLLMDLSSSLNLKKIVYWSNELQETGADSFLSLWSRFSTSEFAAGWKCNRRRSRTHCSSHTHTDTHSHTHIHTHTDTHRVYQIIYTLNIFSFSFLNGQKLVTLTFWSSDCWSCAGSGSRSSRVWDAAHPSEYQASFLGMSECLLCERRQPISRCQRGERPFASLSVTKCQDEIN